MSISTFFTKLSDTVVGFFSKNRHYVTARDLERIKANRGTTDVRLILNEVSGKINMNVGSTKLRNFMRAYRTNDFSSVRTSDLNYIANEINVLVYGEVTRYKPMGGNTGVTVKAAYKGSRLNNSQNTWASNIMVQVGLIGSSDVKACMRSADDVLQFIRIESGLNRDGTVNIGVVNSLGYCGPLQVGYTAWKDAIQNVSPLKIGSKQALIAATKTLSAGGPGDINIMAVGIVKLWNNYWKYVRASKALSDVDKIRIGRMKRDWKTMYLLHNQGAGGLIKALHGKNPIVGTQSGEANLVAKEIMSRAAQSRSNGSVNV